MHFNFKKSLGRFLWSIVLILLLNYPIGVTASDTSTTNKTLVIAGSDFQSQNAKDTVKSILTAMKADNYNAPAGFLFAGDYSLKLPASARDSNSNIAELKSAVSSIYPSLNNQNIILVGGNHETAKGVNYSSSGAHDADTYGVFVINEKDYMWTGTKNVSSKANWKKIVKQTATRLRNYLNKKISQGYTKPIFVISHVPLHVTKRTHKEGDGVYASYLFNVLNKAGAAGLNIVFLYGHNHGKGCEDFHGGSSVFYKPGDQINIAKLPKNNSYNKASRPYETRKLNFVYMNAGYVGYFHAKTNCDKTLTMTNFLFDDKTLTITRYDKKGVHDLKSMGFAANDVAACKAKKNVYASPQIIHLKK